MSSDFLSKKFGWRGGERREVTEAPLGSGGPSVQGSHLRCWYVAGKDHVEW